MSCIKGDLAYVTLAPLLCRSKENPLRVLSAEPSALPSARMPRGGVAERGISTPLRTASCLGVNRTWGGVVLRSAADRLAAGGRSRPDDTSFHGVITSISRWVVCG